METNLEERSEEESKRNINNIESQKDKSTNHEKNNETKNNRKKSHQTKNNQNKQQKLLNYTFGYNPSDKFLHTLNPVSKMLWFLLMTWIVLIQNSLIMLTLIFIGVIIFSISNQVKLMKFANKLKFLIIFVGVMIVINIFFNAIVGPQQILFYFFTTKLPVRRLAVYYAFRTVLWILNLSTCGLIFLNTTSPKDIVFGLRKFGLSYKIAFSFMVGLRYIPLILDNTNTVIMAQKARGLDIKNAKSIKQYIEMVKDRLVTSLVLIFRNANSTAMSMELRGFGHYNKRTDMYEVPYSKKDSIFIIILIVIMVFLTLYRFGAFGALGFIPPLPSLYHLIWG